MGLFDHWNEEDEDTERDLDNLNDDFAGIMSSNSSGHSLEEKGYDLSYDETTKKWSIK